MRRTFCARCHTVGLARCAHPTRATGPGGKHRARETYRVHPAKTFVDVPTSPFLFSAASVATRDALPDSFTPVASTQLATGQVADEFTTLMHELWAAPNEPVGTLPEALAPPTSEANTTLKRSLLLFPVLLLILGGIAWRSYEAGTFGSESSGLSAEALEGVATELAALPATISEILEAETSGVELSEAATSLTRWSTHVSALMSASVTANSAETSPEATATLEVAGTEARVLQTLLSDALSTRLIIGALDVSPNLPEEATLDEVVNLRVSLALSIDNARSRLNLLPTSSAEMERSVLGMLSDMEQAHALYLAGLRNGEPVDVAEALGSLEATQAAIDQSLTAYLSALQPEANTLRTQLEELVRQLG